MEERSNVPQHHNQVVYSPALDQLIDSSPHNAIHFKESCVGDRQSIDRAVEYTQKVNPSNELHSSDQQGSYSAEDDCTSCASDYESSSSCGIPSIRGSGVFHVGLRSSDLTRSKSPRDDLKLSQASEKKSYHLDFDLSHDVGKDIYDITDLKSIPKFVSSRIETGQETQSFLITNLGSIVNQFNLWKSELPMVKPYYAVKCNPDIAIVRLLAALGCYFDCATQGEIDLVLHGLGDELSMGPRGLAHEAIVYANPAKMASHLQFAVDNGVRMTVFDGEDELIKISKIRDHENLQLLLRLTTDDRASICQFSKKFGCPVREAPALLKTAKALGLHVAGVSFHVGSGCGDANAYLIALDHARQVFDAADELGMDPMHIIDIGGGFPGDTGGYGGPGMPTFQDLASAVRAGIENFAMGFKRPMSTMRIIAEPGRFFVSACTSVATKVYSRKGGNGNTQALYVDDGVYGTFNNIVYDHATPVPLKLSTLVNPKQNNSDPLLPTVVFGPTCDGLDQLCSLDKTKLPRCEVDDWLYWENMGAYTHTASFVFNGYTHIPSRCYCFLLDV